MRDDELMPLDAGRDRVEVVFPYCGEAVEIGRDPETRGDNAFLGAGCFAGSSPGM